MFSFDHIPPVAPIAPVVKTVFPRKVVTKFLLSIRSIIDCIDIHEAMKVATFFQLTDETGNLEKEDLVEIATEFFSCYLDDGTINEHEYAIVEKKIDELIDAYGTGTFIAFSEVHGFHKIQTINQIRAAFGEPLEEQKVYTRKPNSFQNFDRTQMGTHEQSNSVEPIIGGKVQYPQQQINRDSMGTRFTQKSNTWDDVRRPTGKVLVPPESICAAFDNVTHDISFADIVRRVQKPLPPHKKLVSPVPVNSDPLPDRMNTGFQQPIAPFSVDFDPLSDHVDTFFQQPIAQVETFAEKMRKSENISKPQFQTVVAKPIVVAADCEVEVSRKSRIVINNKWFKDLWESHKKDFNTNAYSVFCTTLKNLINRTECDIIKASIIKIVASYWMKELLDDIKTTISNLAKSETKYPLIHNIIWHKNDLPGMEQHTVKDAVEWIKFLLSIGYKPITKKELDKLKIESDLKGITLSDEFQETTNNCLEKAVGNIANDGKMCKVISQHEYNEIKKALFENIISVPYITMIQKPKLGAKTPEQLAKIAATVIMSKLMPNKPELNESLSSNVEDFLTVYELSHLSNAAFANMLFRASENYTLDQLKIVKSLWVKIIPAEVYSSFYDEVCTICQLYVSNFEDFDNEKKLTDTFTVMHLLINVNEIVKILTTIKKKVDSEKWNDVLFQAVKVSSIKNKTYSTKATKGTANFFATNVPIYMQVYVKELKNTLSDPTKVSLKHVFLSGCYDGVQE
jgi:hypothetical protein